MESLWDSRSAMRRPGKVRGPRAAASKALILLTSAVTRFWHSSFLRHSDFGIRPSFGIRISVFGISSPHGGLDAAGGGGGALAEGFGPEAIAVAVAALAGETQRTAAGDFAFDAEQIRDEFIVGGDAHAAVLEGGAQSISHLLFGAGGECDGLDLPAEALAGAFGQLHAEAGRVDTGAAQSGQGEDLK